MYLLLLITFSHNLSFLQPRRGCFEIRVEGGEKFISLLVNPFISIFYFLSFIILSLCIYLVIFFKNHPKRVVTSWIKPYIGSYNILKTKEKEIFIQLCQRQSDNSFFILKKRKNDRFAPFYED